MSTNDRLDLADWRRRIADLYAQVRLRANDDPEGAWNHWRTVREELFRVHTQSPLPRVDRAAFEAHHFPYDGALRVEAVVQPLTAANDAVRRAEIPLSDGATTTLEPIGTVEAALPGGLATLTVCWMGGYGDGLFLSFRDKTNGQETYGGGRYLLDAAKSADLGGARDGGALVLDFNFAYHPSCAWDPQWVCPLVMPANRLNLSIRGGETLVAPSP